MRVRQFIAEIRSPRGFAAALMAAAACTSAGFARPESPRDGDSAPAKPAPRRPQRVVQRFDFEEPDNPYPVPRNWVRSQDSAASPRPGFPKFNEAAFDFTTSTSGNASVKLPTRGGSTGLRLAAGAIPVYPQGDYLVRARVRTDGLTRARAFLLTRLLDQQLAPIPDSEVRSAPVLTGGDWDQVEVHVVGTDDAATFMEIELLLLQPQQFIPPGVLGVHQIWPEDLSGAAWFDDIQVMQSARIEVGTTTPGNVILAPQHPALRILVRDLVGEELSVRVQVTDTDEAVSAQATLPLNQNGRPFDWTPDLTLYGWYHVALEVWNATEKVGQAETSLVWLPEHGSHASAPAEEGAQVPVVTSADRARFGIVASDSWLPDAPALGSVITGLNHGWTGLPVWTRQTDWLQPAASRDARLFTILSAMLKREHHVQLCVPSLPSVLVDRYRLDPRDALALADITDKEWMPFLDPILDRFGQRVVRWQIGAVEAAADAPAAESAFWNPRLESAIGTLRTHLGKLVPGPSVSVPWRMDLAAPATGAGAARGSDPDGLMMVVPTWMNETGAFNFGEAWRGAGASRPVLTVVLQPGQADQFGRRACVDWLTKQAVLLWRELGSDTEGQRPHGTRWAISSPWHKGGGTREQLAPDAELAAWRTITDELCDRRIIGEYPSPSGVRCFILSPVHSGSGESRTGALVAWNESANSSAAVVHAHLGGGPIRVVDVFGNARPVEPENTPTEMHTIPLTTSPVFIEGIDAELARFVASVRAEPALIPAVATEHLCSIVCENPWNAAIAGKVQLIPPDVSQNAANRHSAWIVSPDGITAFSVSPNQSKSIPFSVTLPAWEEAGEKELGVIVRLQTDKTYPPIRLNLKLRVGLEDLELTPDLLLAPTLAGPDVVVNAVITNRGPQDRVLRLEVAAPDQPTRELVITDLEPGRTVTKRFIFDGMARAMSGKRIRISLSDVDRGEKLTRRVTVP